MASREENEAVAGLLRRSLARDTNAESVCLEPEVLAAYFEDSLEADEAKTCDAHLSRCGHCREQLAAMARTEELREMHERTQRRLAWLSDWRWLTTAAAVMVLATVWLVRKPQKLVPPNRSETPPLVAANKVAPTKPNSAIAEYDGNALSSTSGSREEAPANRIATNGKSAAVASKKMASSAPKADEVAAFAPSRPEKETQPQLGDSRVAANESSSAPIEGRDSKQSSRVEQQRHFASAGHNFGVQQSQSAQGVTLEAQAEQLSGAPPRPSRAQVATGPGSLQAGTGAGVGSGAGGGAQMKAQAKSAPPPRAAPAGATESGGVIGGVAGANASLDAEIATKSEQGMPSDAKARLRKDRGAALQVLEERSSEKVINTPVPTVKWRISGAGFVERSEDAGATWQGQQLDTEALLAGSAPDGKTCWVVGRNGIIFVTKDGKTWKKISPPASADIVAVSAEDASSAVVTTAEGQRFSTHNRGKKWKLESKPQDSDQR